MATREAISGLSRKELMTLAKTLQALDNASNVHASPQDDDELHKWILDNVGVDIPRDAVCEGHQAPFEFLADMYFERETSAVAMANRGGSKTYMAALWHFLNSKFKPKCESASVGAIEQQALRAYDNLRKIIVAEGKVDIPDRHPDVRTSIMRETLFKNGSKVEVLSGTMAAVNGPHPQKVHTDEVELMDPAVFQESRNMSQSRHGIKAQDIITSTRKRAHGPMQNLIDEIAEAERQGMQPPYRLYTWCVFECAQPQPDCQVANPGSANPCDCERVSKGSWDDGSPRTFRDVCGGRLARSKGWIPLHDIQKVFRTLSQDVWEAQQECTKPSTSGMVLPMFTRDRHCIRRWDPDPSLGKVYMGVDYGGSNPHAVLWFQVLDYDVDWWSVHQDTSKERKAKRLCQGTRVAFDEIYVAEIGNMELADKVSERENAWRMKHPQFRVSRRFVDIQAKAARLDWANHDPSLITQSYAPKNVIEQVKLIKELVQDDQLVIDMARCPMLVDELEAWHYPHQKAGLVDSPEKPVEDFDHAIAATRYAMANLRMMEFHAARRPTGAPRAGGEGYTGDRTSVTGSGPARYLPRDSVKEREHGI